MTAKVVKDIGNAAVVNSVKQCVLNYTDIVSNSNKAYSIELIECSDGMVRLLTNYGRVGGTMVKEYRECNSVSDGEKEFDKIVKSKTKKGYQRVELARTEIGSDLAKSKVSASSITEDTAKKLGFEIKEENQSSLHPAIQSVVRSWFGSIEQFIVNTLDTSKCALGQLSLEQINKGRDLLLEARKIVAAGAKDITLLNEISSKYYSNIPMNFGYTRLDANQLRFDNDNKLDQAFDCLDTLENAKGAEKVLTKKNAIDEQYRSLKTEMEWVDPKDDVYKWIEMLFHKTWSNNHKYLGKVVVKNVFAMQRAKEFEDLLSYAEKISKQNASRKELPELISSFWSKRPKENKDYEKYYDSTNILPLFHGTRTENVPKIIQSSLRFRKPGYTISGSMYDKIGGLYFGFSSKALGYSSISGSYWASGKTITHSYFYPMYVLVAKK